MAQRSGEIPEHPRPWLFGVALKSIANRRRGGRRRGALASRLGQTADAGPSPRTPMSSPGDVLAAFRTLAPADQQILSLVAWEELTPAEAAEVLSMPVARFSVRLHRAKQRLRRRLVAPAPQENHLITETR